MLKVKKHIYIAFFSLVLLISCKDPKEYRIAPAFTDYLQRFETEGALRGHNFSPQTDGLIIEFANLSANTAGLTHYETPIRIEIDKAYWNDITSSAGADLMKEDLLFHELGHGLLGRSHLNTTLDNDDWKSIMCGGTKVADRAWNINYRGVRRKYYVDELFDVNTVLPDFASLTLPVDTTGFTTVYSKTFTNVSQSIWLDKTSSQLAISIDNRRIRFQSSVDKIFLVFASLPSAIDINSTFSYEMTFYYPTGDVSNQYGLIFGPVAAKSDGTSDPIEYFTINNNKKMYMGNRSCYSFYTELSESSIVSAGVNKLKVYKFGTSLYYFINNVYCYTTEMVANANINEVGFMMPALGTVWLTDLIIAYKGGSAENSMKIKQIQPIDVRIQAIDKQFQHTVKDR
ncbi:MAG: hypothetical protein WCG08_13295 [Paludibacter sp.]